MTSRRVRVAIPPDSGIIITTFVHRQILGVVQRNKHMTLSDEVEQWAKDNSITIYDALPVMVDSLDFDTPQDAILFKLRWL